MKPVLILLDNKYVVAGNTAWSINYLYLVQWLHGMGIPTRTKVIVDPDFVTGEGKTPTTAEVAAEAANYSIAVVPYTVAVGTNGNHLTKWVDGSSGIPCVMYGPGTSWMVTDPDVPTGAATNSFASGTDYEPIIDANGNRFYPRVAIYYTGALSSGYTPVLWGESGTYADKPVAWKIGTGANMRYTTICNNTWVTMSLIFQAFAAAGIVPTNPFKFYVTVDDIQELTDITPDTETDMGLLGFDQFVTWLRVKGASAMLNLSQTVTSLPGWLATNPKAVAAFKGSRDVIAYLVHNHGAAYWISTGTAGIWDTAAKKTTAYDADIAAFNGASGFDVPDMFKRSHNGYVALPSNTATDLGREALLKAGIDTVREMRLAEAATQPTNPRPFSFNDGITRCKGEIAGTKSTWASITDYPESYTDGDIHANAYTHAGATGANTGWNKWAHRCQLLAEGRVQTGGHIWWTHAYQLTMETGYSRDADQSTLLDFLEPIDQMVQASAGWMKWATLDDDYRGLRLKSR